MYNTKEGLTLSQQHTQKQTALIAHLREQLSSASGSQPPETTEAPPPPPPAPTIPDTAPPIQQDRLDELSRENQYLRRELELVASAWYDQQRRYMNSNASVSRGRPTPEPRSFLGKQRRVVEDVMIGKT